MQTLEVEPGDVPKQEEPAQGKLVTSAGGMTLEIDQRKYLLYPRRELTVIGWPDLKCSFPTPSSSVSPATLHPRTLKRGIYERFSRDLTYGAAVDYIKIDTANMDYQSAFTLIKASGGSDAVL